MRGLLWKVAHQADQHPLDGMDSAEESSRASCQTLSRRKSCMAARVEIGAAQSCTKRVRFPVCRRRDASVHSWGTNANPNTEVPRLPVYQQLPHRASRGTPRKNTSPKERPFQRPVPVHPATAETGHLASGVEP